MKIMTDPAGTYFTAACPPLQNLLDRTCEGIAAAADDASRAGLPVGTIVLGGGYGRGEGGVWTGRDGKAEVHNDLDFFLFSDQPDHELLRAWVAEQERHWSARLGIHVDFACLPPQSLDRARESMMLTDLVLGYRAVFGGVDFLEVAARDVDPSRLPLWEASRLLWNRGSGLFFARCRLQEWCEWDFIERNQQKLALALGDALLCLAGKYHPMVAERYRRVVELPIEHFGVADGERLRSLHREAVEYKLRPAPVEQDRARWRQRDEELTRLWADVFLKVESARTGRDFANLAEYIADRRRLVPESPLWRNFLISVRDRRNHGKRLSPAWEYPRATVMRCLAAIHSDDATSAAALLGEAPVDSCRQLESVYTDWWNRYQ